MRALRWHVCALLSSMLAGRTWGTVLAPVACCSAVRSWLLVDTSTSLYCTCCSASVCLALRQYGQPGVLNTTTAASAPTCAAAGSACSLWCCSCLVWDILWCIPAALRTVRSVHERDSMTGWQCVVEGRQGAEGCVGVLQLCSGGAEQIIGLALVRETKGPTQPHPNCID